MSSTIDLIKIGWTYRFYNQRFHSSLGIVVVLFHKSRINNVDNTVDSDRGLGNIRGEHDLITAETQLTSSKIVKAQAYLSSSFWRWLEDLGLHIAGQIRVDRRDDQLWHLVAQSHRCLAQVLFHRFDLFLTLSSSPGVSA
jgi:hypothetical protein